MTTAIAIFDIGKTNKKLFLIDEQYRIVLEKSENFAETTDEDGDACEDLGKLTDWVVSSFREVSEDQRFEIKAVNFSAYGASFVHLDTEGVAVAPLYNYLKPLSEVLKRQFYEDNGSEAAFSRVSASPVLGNLNSGMQIYRLKYEKPEVFKKIAFSLHLPQYLSYLFSKQTYSDITSIGCHTNLWNFDENRYADWVAKEGILEKLPPLFPSDSVVETDENLKVGVGLHDSSSALIPYLRSFDEPFLLISTGTWCISMNPFNDSPLTDFELENDCLCYMTFQGKPVKSARLFAGFEHEEQTKRIAEYFNLSQDFYKNIAYDAEIIAILRERNRRILRGFTAATVRTASVFGQRDLADLETVEYTYHQLILDLMAQQVASTELVLRGSEPIERLFVDGGFSKNPIYMTLLAQAFPHIQVYAASVAQASAMGAALAIHPHWNEKDVPTHLIDLKKYG
ncbi:MAG: carbohydrate kinase [Saprospiraceae bacterium]|nr:carbohydrate kinase [Saprospiraceae bacterium]